MGREYCLISKGGNVVNMCMSYRPDPPVLTEEQVKRGYQWVPVSQVPVSKLIQYKYWTERP